MIEYQNGSAIEKKLVMPQKIKAMEGVTDEQRLLEEKPACVSFSNEKSAQFCKKGGYILLDFGKELCGGVRIISGTGVTGQFRITFGESLMEACCQIGEKNSTNDHSPRDFEILVPTLSDLTFGQTGFRFVKLELLNDGPVYIRNIFAVNTLPYFEKEGEIQTNDELLNQIMDTAAYTLKLNFQSGYIWDGIKRDRLVWSGDLHQEVLLGTYLFGDHSNILNSLRFLKAETSPKAWINGIPTYSAWWVISLCDYCRLSGNWDFFRENQDYALTVMENIHDCIDENGEMDFSVAYHFMAYFLDWPTLNYPDAKIGTAALLMYMAKTYLKIEENQACRGILRKLNPYLSMDCQFKQTRAFQILAGRDPAGEADFLEKDGASGFSTFMAYYILKADAMAGGKQMLNLIREYFGGMLSRGATTFWEDFDLKWLEGSGRIDEFVPEGQKDIHGDYGDFCYRGFRHSLCHGWSSGVLAFLLEEIVGIAPGENGTYTVNPRLLDLKTVTVKLPVKTGWLCGEITPDCVKKQNIL